MSKLQARLTLATLWVEPELRAACSTLPGVRHVQADSEKADQVEWSIAGRANALLVQPGRKRWSPFLRAWSQRTLDTRLIAIAPEQATAEELLTALRASTADALLPPVGIADLRASLDRQFGSLETSRSLEEVIAGVDLASLPELDARQEFLRSLWQDLGQSTTTIELTMGRIAAYPAIAAAVIQAAISAHPTRASGEMDLRTACIRLGVRGVAARAHHALLTESLPGGSFSDLAARMRLSGAYTAAGARALGQAIGLRRLDELYLCGLLHNLGELAILTALHRQTPREATMPRYKNLVIDAVVGAHAEVGARLLQALQAPGAAIRVAAAHHDERALAQLPAEEQRVANCCNLAWEFSQRHGLRYPRRGARFAPPRLAARLGLDAAQASELCRKAQGH